MTRRLGFNKNFILFSRNICCLIINRQNHSIEADIMVEDSDEKSGMIEGAIGELSSVHNTFSYYAQAVDGPTSVLPNGWKERFVKVCNENTHSTTGLCLEIHDLMISKLSAGRQKNLKFF